MVAMSPATAVGDYRVARSVGVKPPVDVADQAFDGTRMPYRDGFKVAACRDELQPLNHVGSVQAPLVVRDIARDWWELECLASSHVPTHRRNRDLWRRNAQIASNADHNQPFSMLRYAKVSHVYHLGSDVVASPRL
jgi:hypothetical protein